MKRDAEASKCLWNFLLKLSGFYVCVKLFHFNGNENNSFIAIKVKLGYWTYMKPDKKKKLILEENFKRHLEAFASVLFNCISDSSIYVTSHHNTLQ